MFGPLALFVSKSLHKARQNYKLRPFLLSE